VDNIEQALEELKAKGYRLIDEKPRYGQARRASHSSTPRGQAASFWKFQSGITHIPTRIYLV